MSKRAALIAMAVSAIFVGPIGSAQTQVPLMPPRSLVRGTERGEMPTRVSYRPRPSMPATPYSTVTAGSSERGSHSALGIGAELGLLGRGAGGTGSDVLGLQFLWGGRAFVRVPVWGEISLRPSLGYFRRSEGSGGAGVTQNQFELGVDAEYSLLHQGRTRISAGIASRLDLLLSTFHALADSSSNPLTTRFRVGPKAGLLVGLDPRWSFSWNAEVTFGLTQPSRTYMGTALGIVRYLD